MTASPDAPMPRSAPASLAWLAVVALVVLARIPFLGMDGWARIGTCTERVVRGFSETDDALIQRATGISPELVRAIRDGAGAEGRLIVYSPYGGREFAPDAMDPRGEPARQTHQMFVRAKNLLYPDPRDVSVAFDQDELLAQLAKPRDPALALLVLDGTQGAVPLTVGGDWDLLHRHALGGTGQLRIWRWRP